MIPDTHIVRQYGKTIEVCCAEMKELQESDITGSGSGEFALYVWVQMERVSFSDGWNIYPSIEFNYCPYCGVKRNDS